MRGYDRAHFWSLSVMVWVATSAQIAIAQAPSATPESGWLTPTTVGVPAAIGIAALAWWKRINVARITKPVVALLKNLMARGTSATDRQRVGDADASPPAEDDIADATVMVRRGGFGSITCVSGKLLGQRWEIPAQGLSIGRAPGSDVVVDDTHVSATHAHIRPKQGRVVVVDDSTTNGTFLNDAHHRVQGEAPLSAGDVVMLSTTDAAHFIYRK
jgi:hypothetical protein